MAAATDTLAVRARQAHAFEYLHLFVLATYAITQPVYDRLSDRGGFLADAGFKPASLVVLSVLLSGVIPLLAPLVLWIAGCLGRDFRHSAHIVLIFFLTVVIALPVCKRCNFLLADWMVIALSVGGAAVGTNGYFTWRRMRSLVTLLSPWVVVFPVLFLTAPSIKAFFLDPVRVECRPGNPAPVVVIVLDELCGQELVNLEREIDGERFPHFGELARVSTWFRNATTVFPDTWQALPVILSGKLPGTRAAPRPVDLPQNLFSVLGATGEYQMAVFEPISRLAPAHGDLHPNSANSGIAQVASVAPVIADIYAQHLAPDGMRTLLPEIPREWFGLRKSQPVDRQSLRGIFRYGWGENRRTQAEHFLDCLDTAPQPALYFFHVLLPHVPWCYLPSGRMYLPETENWELLDFDTHTDSPNNWGTDELYVTHSQQRQLLQLQFADALLGRTLSRLRETGLFDRCLLIVTADHGISFKTGQLRRGVSAGNLADIMSVPLFIKAPGQRAGAISDRNVESIDILPTIADVLKIRLPLPVDGRSVYDESAAERTCKTIYRNMDRCESTPTAVVKDGTCARDLRRRFGAASDSEACFRVGPCAELIGRAVGELPVATGPVVKIELIRSGTRYTTDPDDIVPCYHEGRVISPAIAHEPVRIAVAVNGVIRAVTRTYELDGIRDRWAALFPESALRPGENEVRYYSVADEDPHVRLTECQIKSARAAPPGR